MCIDLPRSESNAGSGMSTPKTQEAGDPLEAAEASKRERAKAMAAATAAAGAIVQAEEEEAQVRGVAGEGDLRLSSYQIFAQ